MDRRLCILWKLLFLEISRWEIFHHEYVLILLLFFFFFFKCYYGSKRRIAYTRRLNALHYSVTKNYERKIPFNPLFLFCHCKALNRVEIGSRNKKQRCSGVRGIIQAAVSSMIPFFSRAPHCHFPSSARLIPLLTARGKTNGTDKLQRGSRIAMRAANRARR